MSEKQIIEKLDTVNEKVDKLLLWQAALDERCENHRKETDEMRRALYEDNPGLVSKVQALESCKKNLSTSRSRWINFWMYLLKALVVMGVVSFIGLMIKVLGIINLFNGAK